MGINVKIKIMKSFILFMEYFSFCAILLNIAICIYMHDFSETLAWATAAVCCARTAIAENN